MSNQSDPANSEDFSDSNSDDNTSESLNDTSDQSDSANSEDLNNSNSDDNISENSNDMSNQSDLDNSEDFSDSNSDYDSSENSNDKNNQSNSYNSEDFNDNNLDYDSSENSNDMSDQSDSANSEDLNNSNSDDNISENSNDMSNQSDPANSEDFSDSNSDDNTSESLNDTSDQSDSANSEDLNNSNSDDNISENSNDMSNQSDLDNSEDFSDSNSDDNMSESSNGMSDQSDLDSLDDFDEEDDNDFDNLMNNYEDEKELERSKSNSSSKRPSDKLSDVNATKVYNVLKKLVSLSYERYEKGTYRYNKKEIVKHYITNQKFKILNDTMSPIFKPDVYVFDLSPSNDNSLELYVNAISSLAVKGSIIYLTFNERILRKLTIKKYGNTSIDVNKIATTSENKYKNFDCEIYDDGVCFLYEELVKVRDRNIYVFSDFDVSDDMTKLSQKNREIVWFSTQTQNYSFLMDYPVNYQGYYVETENIDDIEKYVLTKNKSRYRRKFNANR